MLWFSSWYWDKDINKFNFGWHVVLKEKDKQKTRKLHSTTDSISFKKQCSNTTMFQLIHDYNALPIHESVEFLDIQYFCAYFIIHEKLLIVLNINKTFLIVKSYNMRMFHFLVFSHIDRRLSFLKIFLVKLKFAIVNIFTIKTLFRTESYLFI